MRTLLAIVPALLVAAAASANARPVPDLTLAYGDLALDTRSGQQQLAQRIAATAEAHCREHGAAITPQHLRDSPRFCRGAVSAELVRALPAHARSAIARP